MVRFKSKIFEIWSFLAVASKEIFQSVSCTKLSQFKALNQIDKCLRIILIVSLLKTVMLDHIPILGLLYEVGLMHRSKLS